MTITADALYQERLQRFQTAVSLKEGDRVPFIPKVSLFQATGYGINSYDVMKDYRNLAPGIRQFAKEYDPDMIWPMSTYPLDPLETLGVTALRWPGAEHNLPLTSSFQVIDDTYMQDDEFDEFLLDPTHFMLTKVLPRKNKALKGFEKFYFRELYELSYILEFSFFSDPEVVQSLLAAMHAGKHALERKHQGAYIGKLIRELGYPSRGAALVAPFDAYADSLRGLIQAIIDIKERPQQVMEVVNRIASLNTAREVAGCKARGETNVFIPLHAGVDEFMSPADYATYYWPTLRQMIVALIDADITPYVFCEGRYYTRLEQLRDVPAGKVVYMFEQVDIKEAKRVLGDVACICGNIPSALLMFGKKEQVVDATKKMLDDCAPGGGFIMDCSIILDNADHENLAAWRETTLTYGQY